MSTDKPLLFWLEMAGRPFAVREVRGRESISAPFRLELRFVIPEGGPIDPASVIKSEASLALVRERPLRTITGLITDFKVRATRRGAPEVTLVLEPKFALTRLRSDIRVFREKTAVEIVTEVLAGHGIRPELRLRETYERRHYCVQFRETDFDFVNRLLEDEGIFYFFLEGDVMVLGDNTRAYEPIAAPEVVPFRAGMGMDENIECVVEIGRRAALVPSKVTLRDFNPEKPRLNMDVQADVPSPSGAEWYDFPGEYLDPGYGARKAKLTGESFAVASGAFTGITFCGRFLPGCELSLIDGPEAAADGKYVITAVEHEWVRDRQGFSLRFDALSADVTFRAPRVTPAPRLLNPVTGFVTGPAGEDIYTDEWGRVKVHLHWDRRQPLDEECSYWIPVLQDNTGQSCGIPRIGWEVLVHFLEGDPDRPVVLGRVYNAEDEFPQKLPLYKTRSALRSQSSPGRRGTNEIRFEDIAGEQHIYVYAEKDQNVVIANNKNEHILNNEGHAIDRDEAVSIGGNTTIKVGADLKQEVGVDQTHSVGGSRTRRAGKADSARVKKDRSLTVGGMHFRRIGTNDQVACDNLRETVGGAIIEASVKSNFTQGEKGALLAVGGAVVEVAKKDKSENANESRKEFIGGLFFTKAGKEIATRSNTVRQTSVGGMLNVTAKEQIAVSGVEELSVKAGAGEIAGKGSITLKVGDTKVVLKDGAIDVTAKTVIKMIVSGNNKQGAKTSTQI